MSRYRYIIKALLTIIGLMVLFPTVVNGKSNEIFLSWVDGPAASFKSNSKEHGELFVETGSDRMILRSEKYALLIDSRQLTIPRVTTRPSKGSAAIPVAPDLPESTWAESFFELSAEIDGQRYVARMVKTTLKEQTQREKELDYPVRIIESGNYFNHIDLCGIEWVSGTGKVLPGKGRLECRAWGDRGVFEYSVEAIQPLKNVKLDWRIPQLQFTHQKLVKEISRNKSVRIRLGYQVNEGRIVPFNPTAGDVGVRSLDDNNTTKWNRSVGCWEIHLGKTPRNNPKKENEPFHLDLVTEVPFILENKSDKPLDIPLRFIHPQHPITGYVPLLFDNKGRPTGIKVQSSKNWHRTEKHPIAYEGPWINGSTRITLPPNTKRRFRYAIVHARWQGVPAASVGQLSLVGWGHNGFWTQMALGSWGENFCIQPGRLQRRALITDVRPSLVLGMKTQKPWDWTSNVGGGDTMMLFNSRGRYWPWGGVASDFIASGPNLAHYRINERSANEAIFLQTDTYMPRNDDFLRVYMRIKMKVDKEVRFSRASLFQLGTDNYNANSATQLCFGSGSNLQNIENPGPGKIEYVTKPAAINGDQPWITLTKSDLDEKGPHQGKATRSLIIRDFEAVLGGKTVKEPFVAGYRTWHGDLMAEIVPPPKVKRFRKGDQLNMLLEFAVFPVKAEDYFGEDQALINQLNQHADTWKMTAWEADHNAPVCRINNGAPQTEWPLQVSVRKKSKIDFEIEGGAGLIPVQITGMPSPHAWQIFEKTNDRKYSLGGRYSEEAKPQVEYNQSTNTYTVTLSLRPANEDDDGKTRRFHWVSDR